MNSSNAAEIRKLKRKLADMRCIRDGFVRDVENAKSEKEREEAKFRLTKLNNEIRGLEYKLRFDFGEYV